MVVIRCTKFKIKKGLSTASCYLPSSSGHLGKVSAPPAMGLLGRPSFILRGWGFKAPFASSSRGAREPGGCSLFYSSNDL